MLALLETGDTDMKKILIIGATSGIAGACARLCAAERAELFLVGRNADKLQQTADDLTTRGAAAVHTHTLDLNQFDAHPAMLDAAFRQIDIALIAHGTLPDQKACEHNVDLALQEFSNNGLSVIALLTALAPRME